MVRSSGSWVPTLWSAGDSGNVLDFYSNGRLIESLSSSLLDNVVPPSHYGNPNTGDGAAEQVKVHAILSDGLEHAAGNHVDFEIGNLAANESRNVQLICAARSGGEQKCAAWAEAEGSTAHNSKLTLNVAFNYGGRQEIARAASRIASEMAAGRIAPGPVTADLISSHLDAPDIPDPDLLIRTSGEQRLSNFLLWQCVYSELVFVPIYWPDFDRQALDEAVAVYRQRERRFGGLAAKARS